MFTKSELRNLVNCKGKMKIINSILEFQTWDSDVVWDYLVKGGKKYTFRKNGSSVSLTSPDGIRTEKNNG